MTERVIPTISDQDANRANFEAIDGLIRDCAWPYIVGWGKLLGFTPEMVREYVEAAKADKPPATAIQKVEGEWLLLSDIANESNRQQVAELANRR